MTTINKVPYYERREHDVEEVIVPLNQLELEVAIPPLGRLIEEYAKAFDALPEYVVEKTLRPIRDLHDRLEAALELLKTDEPESEELPPGDPVTVGADDVSDIPF